MGVGGWVESRIKLISAEAEALLCLAELGNINIVANLKYFELSFSAIIFICI